MENKTTHISELGHERLIELLKSSSIEVYKNFSEDEMYLQPIPVQVVWAIGEQLCTSPTARIIKELEHALKVWDND